VYRFAMSPRRVAQPTQDVLLIALFYVAVRPGLVLYSTPVRSFLALPGMAMSIPVEWMWLLRGGSELNPA